MNLKQPVSLTILIFIQYVCSQPPRSLFQFLQQPSDVIAFPGNTVLLECVIIDSQSNDLLGAQWYRNGIITEGLQRHQNFRDLRTNLTIALMIANIMETDSGAMYHCTPNGQQQITSRKASVIVAGVPEFQGNGNVISVLSTNVSSISIQWQPAITFPIAPVTKYIISLYDDTELQNTFEFFANVTMLSFTFNELKAATNYHISIVAENSIGASKPTANFTVITKPLTPIQPLPPANVDVCVSFDTLSNPTLQIQWQEPPNSDNQVNQYYVYYGKEGDTMLESTLVNTVNVAIQLSENSLNETFVVQLSTFTKSVESSMTAPVMQYINPLYAVEKTSITPSSAALQCRLACMTEDLQCIITSLDSAGLQPTIKNVNKTSQQFLVLEGLHESTMYEYCISAYNTTKNEHIGFPICGMLKTTANLQSQSSSSLDEDVPLSDAAVVGIIVGVIVIMILMIIIMIIVLVICCLRKRKQSEKNKVATDFYAATTVEPNCDPQANINKSSLNYVDLDISGTSGTHKIKDTSVSYAQVVIPRSRKEQSNEINQHVNQTDQQVNQNDQQKKAASLKFGYAELDLSTSSIQSDTQTSTHVKNDTAVTNSRTNIA